MAGGRPRKGVIGDWAVELRTLLARMQQVANPGALIGVSSLEAKRILELDEDSAIDAINAAISGEVRGRLLTRLRKRRSRSRPTVTDIWSVRLPRHLVDLIGDLTAVVHGHHLKLITESVPDRPDHVAVITEMLSAYLDQKAPLLKEVAINPSPALSGWVRMRALYEVSCLPETSPKSKVLKVVTSVAAAFGPKRRSRQDVEDEVKQAVVFQTRL